MAESETVAESESEAEAEAEAESEAEAEAESEAAAEPTGRNCNAHTPGRAVDWDEAWHPHHTKPQNARLERSKRS